jgi:hypothetical protein
MIILKTQNDFPQKVEEMKVMYSSKAEAMMEVDNAIDYLRRVKIYRQYTEADVVFERQVVLHLKLKEYLNGVPDWAKVPEVKPSLFSKAFHLITTWHINILVYLLKSFPRWFSRIRSRVLKKHAQLKKKSLI